MASLSSGRAGLYHNTAAVIGTGEISTPKMHIRTIHLLLKSSPRRRLGISKFDTLSDGFHAGPLGPVTRKRRFLNRSVLLTAIDGVPGEGYGLAPSTMPETVQRACDNGVYVAAVNRVG